MELQRIVVLCIIVAVLGGGVWYVTGRDSGVESDEMTSVETEQMDDVEMMDEEDLSGFGSFASLLGLGRDISCEYSYTDDDGNAGSGEGYFSGNLMRVDSVLTDTDGTVYTSHMINDGTTMYTWTETTDGTFAVMMPAAEFEEDPSDYMYESETETTGEVSVEQEVEYDCEGWSVDASVFVPPSDVEFTDMAAMMESMMQGLPEGFEMPEGFPMQ